MQKTKTIIFKHFTTSLFLVLGILLLPNSLLAQSVGQLQQQIDQKTTEINRSERRIQNLRQRADTLQNRLNILNAEADQIRSQINVTESEIKRTRAEIRAKEAELARLKKLIQENVKVLYKNGDPSTVEVLFSSDSFSDFISRQEYLSSAKNSMNQAAAESVKIKNQLEAKESELKNKIAKLEGQRNRLAAKQSEQRQLLAQTRGQERRYQSVVANQRSERANLEAQQRAAIAQAMAARSGGPSFSGSSSYPWVGASMNYDDNCRYPNGSVGADPWGYCLRQCTSYVAWKLSQDGRSGFSGLGHAITWRNGGTRIGNFHNAQRGDVIVWGIGFYGHVMYVESVTGGGINISQFNIPYGSGSYSSDFYSFNELQVGDFTLHRF